MGQVVRGSATTTEAVDRAIQPSRRELEGAGQALRDQLAWGLIKRPPAKWKGWTSVADLPTGPRKPHSSVLSGEEEAVGIAFRRHTLPPLDDCLYEPPAYDPTPDEYACALSDIDHRLTKPKHPWTNGQVERMNRTIKDATVKRCFCQTHDEPRVHLRDFVDAYNFARRLKIPKGLTPYAFICDRERPVATDDPGSNLPPRQCEWVSSRRFAICRAKEILGNYLVDKRGLRCMMSLIGDTHVRRRYPSQSLH